MNILFYSLTTILNTLQCLYVQSDIYIESKQRDTRRNK